MSNPTPGPWEMETFPDGSFEIYTKPNEFLICERAESAFPEETKANARLIAAAPEMYELIKELYENGGMELTNDQWVKYRDVVMKATGEA